MSGGSTEPEGPHDRECPHCGLYYRDQGVSFQMHEASCEPDGETSKDVESEEDVTDTSESSSETSGGLGVSDESSSEETVPETTENTTANMSETVDCPICEEDTNETEEALAGSTWQCTECGGRFEVTPD